MGYDYREAVKEDVLEYIKNEINFEEYETLEELEEKLNDELWTVDSVTGNASGSYTFNSYQAEENIAHNWELLNEALTEFGNEESPVSKGAEWCDVTIRCYLLGECIAAALEDVEGDVNAAHDEEDKTMTIQTLIHNPNYYIHHTASRRGYISRKSDGKIEPYEGRFGVGYILLTPRYDTTQYVNIIYYIRKAGGANY